jgi:hypothetical protein
MTTHFQRSIGFLVLLSLTCLGCAKDPFSTRPPSRPTGEQGTYRTPVDPQIALDTNLYYAMVERNASHYPLTLADSLVYVFDYLLTGPPDSALTWGKLEEDRIARNLFAGTTAISVAWWPTPGRSDRYEDTLTTLYRTYEITASILEQEGTKSYDFKGEMVVQLARNPQDLWWIVRWEDLHKGDGAPSWADLKSRFR